MNNLCNCGSEMDITLRTLNFGKSIQIKNVPVFSCPDCENNELIDLIKEKIKTIVNESDIFKKQTIYFDKICELAQLFIIAYNEQDHFDLEKNIQGEIQDLLDNIILEGQFQEDWEGQIHKKITKVVH